MEVLGMVIKIASVFLIMMFMVALLLALNHFMVHNDGESNMDRLRRDIEDADDVISKDSLFHTFLLHQSRKKSTGKLKHHNVNIFR